MNSGVLEEKQATGGSDRKVKEEGGGDLLSGAAKKTKLLEAYGNVHGVAADEDEIDLDEADEDEIDLDEADDALESPVNGKRDDISSSKEAGDINNDKDEIVIGNEDYEPAAGDFHQAQQECSEPAPSTRKISKKAALQKRFASLRAKINQSRTLNRREVRAEAASMGTDEARAQERKRQNKQDRKERREEYGTYAVGKLRKRGGNESMASDESSAEQKRLAGMSQPAYDSIRQMNVRANKEEMRRYGPDDYYNPEGQYSNYERNLTSMSRLAPRRREEGAPTSVTFESYDPTLNNRPNGAGARDRSSDVLEREGAKRLALEMKRRAEKRANKKQRIEFDAADVTSINDRNKRFNQKIGRNFDAHTAEIRQNLERGTAL